MRLADEAWPQVGRGGVLVLPLGATEQHGPHLPIGTDTWIVDALVTGLELLRPEVWVAPTVAVGASGEHDGFPGTLSLGRRALALSVLEIGRSADHFDGIFVVNWHGGNIAPIRTAVEKLREEGRSAEAWGPDPERMLDGEAGDLHAGRIETSLMLAIRPGSVRQDRAEAGTRSDGHSMLRALRAQGVRAVSPNGVIGDPSGASAEEGSRILDTLVARLASDLLRFEAGPSA